LLYLVLKCLFILKLGSLSLFNDEGLRSGELLGQLGSEIIDIDDHIIFGIYGEVKNATETSNISAKFSCVNFLFNLACFNLVPINLKSKAILIILS